MTAITAWLEKESHAIAKDWQHEDRGILRIKLADKGDRRSPFGLFLPLEGEPRRGDALGEYGDEARGGRYDCFAAQLELDFANETLGKSLCIIIAQRVS